jgi:type II secretory pathway pseudopilin PulG
MSSLSREKAFQKGFTFMELVVITTMLIVLISAVIIFVNPSTQSKKARDNIRLSDLTVLERSISEFVLDNNRYPDQVNVLRMSTTLPPGVVSLQDSKGGWINDNLSKYNEKLPIDPINDSSFYYSYTHDDTGFELNAKMEYYTQKMFEDGGNDNDVYEVGNNLNLISP